MDEETTRNLPDGRLFEERVFAELAAMRMDFTARFDGLDARLTVIEERVERRLQETRPLWEEMQTRLTAIESILDEMEGQLRLIVGDLFKTRARVEKLEERPPAA